MQLVLKSLI